MNEIILWTNRIVCGALCAIMVWICEKYNFRPAICFILAFVTLIGLTFLFEIIKHILGGNE